jgi:acyl carrier protein
MDAQLLRARVVQVVSEYADDCPADQIHDDTALESLGISDSLDRFELAMGLEDEFAVAFSDAQESAITSPAATVATCIEQVTQAKGTA